MDEDEKSQIYHKGFRAGQEHTGSSKETIEKIDDLKVEINTFKIFMDTITKKINEICEDMKDGFSKNSEEHKEILDKKADKEVVDQIRADIRKVVWTVVGGVLVSLLALVLKA